MPRISIRPGLSEFHATLLQAWNNYWEVLQYVARLRVGVVLESRNFTAQASCLRPKSSRLCIRVANQFHCRLVSSISGRNRSICVFGVASGKRSTPYGTLCLATVWVNPAAYAANSATTFATVTRRAVPSNLCITAPIVVSAELGGTRAAC